MNTSNNCNNLIINYTFVIREPSKDPRIALVQGKILASISVIRMIMQVTTPTIKT
jgi:hypothetical protein